MEWINLKMERNKTVNTTGPLNQVSCSQDTSVLSGGVLKVGVGYVLLVGGDLCKDNEVQLKDAEELWLSMA